MSSNVPTQMQAAAIDQFGGPETITIHTLPVPEAGPDEILIRVETAGVGVWDPMERAGKMVGMMQGEPQFPYVLGSDGAGTVAAVGDSVTRFQTGDRVHGTVFLHPTVGFYAEYTTVKAENAAHIPDKLPTEQAGALTVDAITALNGLDDALGLQEGESVLIFGASGGVGHLAVQLAKRMGARVLAVASGEDGVEFCQRLGTDAVVNGRKDRIATAIRDFAPDGLDAALLTASSAGVDDVLAAVKEGGRVAYPGGVELEQEPRAGVSAQQYNANPDRRALDQLNRLIESGPFEVHIARTFPLSQAGEAHRALDEHYLGKLALQVA